MCDRHTDAWLVTYFADVAKKVTLTSSSINNVKSKKKRKKEAKSPTNFHRAPLMRPKLCSRPNNELKQLNGTAELRESAPSGETL